MLYNFGLYFNLSHMKKLSMDDLNRVDVDAFRHQDKLPVIIVLDNIRSMNNVGSVFRTADAFALEAIYLCGITGTPPHREIYKTALGASDSVAWKYFENTCDAVSALKASGYKVIAVEQVVEHVLLHEFLPDSNAKFAFVFGNEINGVQQDVLDLCDMAIEIPQFGTKHSLNVSVSTGVVVWDLIIKTKKGIS